MLIEKLNHTQSEWVRHDIDHIVPVCTEANGVTPIAYIVTRSNGNTVRMPHGTFVMPKKRKFDYLNNNEWRLDD